MDIQIPDIYELTNLEDNSINNNLENLEYIKFIFRSKYDYDIIINDKIYINDKKYINNKKDNNDLFFFAQLENNYNLHYDNIQIKTNINYACTFYEGYSENIELFNDFITIVNLYNLYNTRIIHYKDNNTDNNNNYYEDKFLLIKFHKNVIHNDYIGKYKIPDMDLIPIFISQTYDVRYTRLISLNDIYTIFTYKYMFEKLNNKNITIKLYTPNYYSKVNTLFKINLLLRINILKKFNNGYFILLTPIKLLLNNSNNGINEINLIFSNCAKCNKIKSKYIYLQTLLICKTHNDLLKKKHWIF
jgi:hypothetical protein